MRSFCRLAVLLTVVAAVACTPDDAVGPTAPRAGRLVSGVAASAVVVPQVAAGWDYSCALSTTGIVTCWGDDPWAAQVAPSGFYTQLEAGDYTACAVSSEGGAVCWGLDVHGQTSAPALPAGLSYTQASVGRVVSCAVRSDGSLGCWGVVSPNVTNNVPGGTYTQVAVGEDHACALRTDGAVVCWGSDTYARVSGAPAAPAGLRFTQVSAGTVHNCARLDDGSLRCWGDNTHGELDVPAPPTGVQYTQVAVSHNQSTLDQGKYFSCALRTDGAVVCWGSNYSGQLNVPGLPTGMTYTGVSSGAAHACAVRSDGVVVCWGLNTSGQSSVPGTLNLNAPRQPQAITFTLPNEAIFGTDLTLTGAGGASGNPVTFTSLTPGICDIRGDKLHLSGIGACTVAADQAGNDSYDDAPRVMATVAIRWAFTGFAGLLAPPTVNKARPGATVDLKFSLGGSFGTAVVLATGSPTAAAYTCGSTPPAPGAGSPVTATNALTYSLKSQQYTYAWPTAKSYANSCYQLSMKLGDGSMHTVLFHFK